MKTIMPLLVLAGSCAAGASAQTMGDQPAKVTLPGITFTRSLNGAAEGAVVSARGLTLSSKAKRDNFRDPDGKLSNETAPVLLTRIDNTKPFTFSARLTPDLRETYDAGTLYIWVRNDQWLKMAMELDERRKARIVTVRTTGTSDDNNHDVVTAKTVFMKISSDAKTVGFYYSLDNKDWQLVRLFRNEYPAEIWVGVSTQSPKGQGTSARFDQVTLTRTSITDFRMGK